MQQYHLIYDPEIISTNTILEKKKYRHLNLFCFEFKFVDNGVLLRPRTEEFFFVFYCLTIHRSQYDNIL